MAIIGARPVTSPWVVGACDLEGPVGRRLAARDVVAFGSARRWTSGHC